MLEFFLGVAVSSVKGFDVADNEIVERVLLFDSSTSDVPLAAEVLDKGGQVITSRGERYTSNNIKQRLQMRGLYGNYALIDDGTPSCASAPSHLDELFQTSSIGSLPQHSLRANSVALNRLNTSQFRGPVS